MRQLVCRVQRSWMAASLQPSAPGELDWINWKRRHAPRFSVIKAAVI